MGDRLNRVRRKFEPLLRRLFHAYFLVVRGMTLGVRAVVLDAENRVFLVRHSDDVAKLRVEIIRSAGNTHGLAHRRSV